MKNQKLLFVKNLDKALSEIEKYNGQVLHVFKPNIVVARFTDNFDTRLLKNSQLTPYQEPDAQTQILLNAWHQMISATKESKKREKTDGLSWDHPGYQFPKNAGNDPKLAEGVKSFISPNSAYMQGSVGVGVWIIQGPTPDLQFSPSEIDNLTSSVFRAMDFWANSDLRSNLTFKYDIRTIGISAQPNPSCSSYESCESVFRDPALQSQGYSTGINGVNDYVTSLKTSENAQWAYMVFFVKYPLFWFAYNAYAINSRYICMQYSNDGWGPSNIDKVFAHESGHSFSAQDEYGSCTCGTQSGQCSVPNNNCINCPGDHQACIMDANVLTVCQWSRGQVGWQYCNSGYETSLPGTGSNIVSVLAYNGNLYAGSDGFVFMLNSSGSIIHTNSLPDRGNHEVRLAISGDGSKIFVGTDGYALALSSSDLSTLWQTSLPGTGSNIVSVLAYNGNLYAGSDGFVFMLNSSGSIIHTNSLPDRGNHEVRLAISGDGSKIFVGTDGYALALSSSDLSTLWQTSLPGTGSNIVSVLAYNGNLYAGSDGFVFMLNSSGSIIHTNSLPDRGNHEVRLAISGDGSKIFVGTDGYALALSSSDLSTLWQTSLPGTGSNIVDLLVYDNYLFAGSDGYLFGLDLKFGSILYTNDLPGMGYHEVRLAAANNTIFIGTDGYALSVNVHSGAPSCSY